MGVDGFREDVITFISKKEGLPDDHIMPASKGFGYFNHGPHLHEYLEEFKEDVFSKYDCMTLAEAPMVKMGIEKMTNMILQKTISDSLPIACKKGLFGSIIFIVISFQEEFANSLKAKKGAPHWVRRSKNAGKFT